MPTTTVYDRGAVVLLPFPFSDQSSGKIRPAIVANPVYPSDDLLIVTTLLWPITRLHRRKRLCSLCTVLLPVLLLASATFAEASSAQSRPAGTAEIVGNVGVNRVVTP